MYKELDEKEKKELKIELEERLMDLIEVTSKYEDIPAIHFELEINSILREIERLEKST